LLNILLVDDDHAFSEAFSEMIEMLGHHATLAHSVAEAKQALAVEQFDLGLLDLMLPDGSGLELLDEMSKGQRATHLAIITGHPVVKAQVRTLCGPHISYLTKPISLDQIKSLLAKAGDKAQSDDGLHFDCLVGESEVMKKLYKTIERVADSGANVMLLGESGVGKELVARAIHNCATPSGAFVAANCGAFSRELIGSELFGHEKGSFTGAIARKGGLFERADQGTLFLDEVTEMPLDLQPTLLRTLETGMVLRVGGTKELPVQCRVISATNRSPQEIAEKNCLREDIYYRLAVFPITIPPLRERRGDIPLLARHFLKELNERGGTSLQLPERDMAKLQAYDWPGNVRELRHTIHRAYIMSDPDSNEIEFPEQLASPFSSEEIAPTGLRVGTTIEDTERQLILMTVEELGGDKRKAAEMLGVSLKTLYNRLNQYERVKE
tara:strand:+ start:23374 stop:24690 length:1317 start_codon:yes stop_codon:yes gene_type:complete